ncbi:hypothetical protein P886_4971 [Alteromonadaceae bacterium 2753L.S.0a.02]|nr:hypothetical protein P886_4971 [Alteromonadaceae bacterium 2753L.S.0a.02]
MRVLVALLLLVTAQTYADTGSDQEISSAKSVVASYKELRKYCSVARGEERRACFRELNEANESYQAAKSLLSSQDEQDLNNLHLVTYVDY